MSTSIRYVDALPVEETILDEDAQAARKILDELVMKEYAETGLLSTPKVREAVAAFEEYAQLHILKENE